HPPHRIDVTQVEGPFRSLNNRWIFEPVAGSPERPAGGTLLSFHIEFELRSALLQSLVGGLFSDAARRMVAAFEGRARQLSGAPPSPAPAARAVARPGSPSIVLRGRRAPPPQPPRSPMAARAAGAT